MDFENHKPFENKLLVFIVRFLRISIGIVFVLIGLSAISHYEMIEIISGVSNKTPYHWLLLATSIGLFFMIIPMLKMGWRKIKDYSVPFSEKSFLVPKLQLFGSLLVLRAIEVYSLSQFELQGEELARYMGIMFAIIFVLVSMIIYVFIVNSLHGKYLKLMDEYEERKQSDVFVEKP
jgi:hypothetical protein